MFSSLCSLSLVQSRATLRKTELQPLHSPPHIHMDEIPLRFLSSRLLFWQMLQTLNHLPGPSVALWLFLLRCRTPHSFWIPQLAPPTISPAYQDTSESNTTISCINHSLKFCINCRLAERGPCPISQVIDKDVTLLVSVLASAAPSSCLISSWSSHHQLRPSESSISFGFQSNSLSTCLTCISPAWKWGCFGKQSQKPWLIM